MPALERVCTGHGVVFYRSRLLHDEGFAHGFSTRHGGVSPAPFDSMNLGIAQAPGESDTELNLRENARRLLEAIGAPHARMVRVKQVHGAQVHACTGAEAEGATGIEADGLVAHLPETAACVRTADCVPILVACTQSGAVAAIHAGWRGIVSGVVARTVESLCAAAGTRPGRLVAAIGPCIGAAVYEVGPETAAQFEAAGLREFVLLPGDGRTKEHLDCFGAVNEQLLRTGIPRDSVDGAELCTVATAGEFFSYRRDGARSGRMAAAIAPRPPQRT